MIWIKNHLNFFINLINIYIYIYIYSNYIHIYIYIIYGSQYICPSVGGVEYSCKGINGCHSHDAKLFIATYYIMPYYYRTDICRLMGVWCDTKSHVKLGGFQSQSEASCVSCHADELWYSETVCLWMTIYIYIYMWIAHLLYIYIYI